MRNTPTLLVLSMLIGNAYGQGSAWQHTTLKDPLTEKTTERVVLRGEYLVEPTGLPSGMSTIIGLNAAGSPPTIVLSSPPKDLPDQRPKLVLVCSNKKLIKQFGILPITAVATPPPVNLTLSGATIMRSMNTKIDLVIDGGRKKTVTVEPIRTTDKALTEDTPQRSYTALDLGNILGDLLHGKHVTMVVRDNPTANVSMSGPLRQSLMEFFMPDPAPLLNACGDDKAIRGIKPNVKDIETGKHEQKFIFGGTFIEQPSGTTKLDTPSLVLVCMDGKLVRQYGLVRVILWNGGIKADAVMDGGRKRTLSLDVMATRDKAMTDDEAHRAFSTFDLQPILLDLLHAKTVRMALRDDYGSSYRGNPPVDVLVEFKVPDSAAAASACGLKL